MSKSPLGKKKIKGTGNWPQTCHKLTELCLQGDDPRPWHSALGEDWDAQCQLLCARCPPVVPRRWGVVAVPPASGALPKPYFVTTPWKMHAVLHAQRLGGCLNLLSPCQTPVSAPSRAALHQGCAGLGAGLQLLWPQPAFGSRALEGTIKKHFALQLKILIKSASMWMAKGEKRVNSVLSLPLEFSDAPGHSLQ